jgi:hypothetical protein
MPCVSGLTDCRTIWENELIEKENRETTDKITRLHVFYFNCLD